MYLIIRWVINALVLVSIPYIIGGFEVSTFWVALVAALILAFLNAIFRPILLLLTLPINILTLGLFTLVINGLIFWFMGSIVKGVTVTGFWPAFWGALIYSVISIIVNYLFDSKKKAII